MKINFLKNDKKYRIKNSLLEFEEIFSAAESCRKCGKCQSVCPVFRQTGLEQHTARGKLALLRGLKNDFLFDSSLIEHHLRFCLLCGRCSNACPTGIDTVSLFLRARNLMHEFDKKSFIKKFLIRVFIKFPSLFSFFKKRQVEFKKNYRHCKSYEKKLVFFTGCLFDRFFPQTTENALSFFKKIGFDPVVVSGECCGLPFLSSGDEKGFMASSEKLYEKFVNIDSDIIVSGCPTCISTLKKIWPFFSKSGKEINTRFDILDFHQFAAQQLKAKDFEINLSSDFKGKWHLPCHLQSIGGKKDADFILKDILRLELDESSRLDSCCGFGGSFSLDHPGVSKKILNLKCEELNLKSGETLLTGCPACILQLERSAGGKNRICHTIDIISENMI
ncbi:MAG: (Fe-S)-binding protein [Desulfobacteraceae bacterium]|nr:(Fe-S)-binding protein [Desulfobacteraceae bacterium]